MAVALLSELGSLGRVMSADEAALVRATGSHAAAGLIIASHGAALLTLERTIKDAPVLSNRQSLLDFLHVAIGNGAVEGFWVLYVNARNMLIKAEACATGTIDQSPFYVREVVRRALELHAGAIILAHNHPSGDPAPSRDDIRMTRDLATALQPLGITLHDHIVVAAGGHVSLRASGLI